MGKIYSVDAWLHYDFEFKKETVRMILAAGALAGVTYHDRDSDDRQPLKIDAATENYFIENDPREDYEQALLALWRGANFFLRFSHDGGHFTVSFSCIDGDTEMESGYRMDYDRFIRLMLDMIGGMPIEKLEASSF